MTIVITLPVLFHREAEQIVQFLHSSIDLIHIRKPNATKEEVEQLIREIPKEYYCKLVLHDHHFLALKYHLHGIHLNSRNPQPLIGWKGSVSRSCHTLEEVKEWKERCDYISLSPIFESISKKGYQAAFTEKELKAAKKEGIIDTKVLALGGVTFNKMDDVLRMGFGGGMILGDAWKNIDGWKNIGNRKSENDCGGKYKQETEDETGQVLCPVALSIAGSDPSAGAGIQQDLKTMAAIGVYGATAITAITSQNTLGVSAVLPLPAETVASQLDAVLSDLHVTSIKIGMIPNSAIAHIIAKKIKEYLSHEKNKCNIVYDPIMFSTSGKKLMEEEGIHTICKELIPLCTLITPNIPEAEILHQYISKNSTEEESENVEYGITLAKKYHTNILLKGGHEKKNHTQEKVGKGKLLHDYLYMTNGERIVFSSEKINSSNLHGTGCTLSSAIASYLLLGSSLNASIEKAKKILTNGIIKGKAASIGKGNGPLLLSPIYLG